MRAQMITLAWLLLGVTTMGSAAGDEETARAAMVERIAFEIALIAPETGVPAIAPPILDAMRQVPRHLFVPVPLRAYAYGAHPLPVGLEQNIAAPLLVALMTQLIEPDPGDRVFETGTGAGYHAAILAELADEVYSVEVVAPLAEQAATTLNALGYDNVHVKADDGYYGWAEHAPYDAILIKEAIDHVPVPLLGQLAPEGRLVLPLGPARGPQILTVVTRAGDQWRQERILEVQFSPLQGGERL